MPNTECCCFPAKLARFESEVEAVVEALVAAATELLIAVELPVDGPVAAKATPRSTS